MLPIAHRHPNYLLLDAPERIREQLSRYIEWVPLTKGQVLSAPDLPARYAYFPATSVLSLVATTPDGQTAEVATVGNEGMLDVSSLLCGEPSWYTAVVREPGSSYRCSATTLRHELSCSTNLQPWLLRYLQSLLTQMTQTALCNRYHTLSEQLCRYLLQSLDRSDSASLAVTHECIANRLGVRREGVTEALGRLRAQDIVDCDRGVITVNDPTGLKELACKCYKIFARATRPCAPPQRARARHVSPCAPALVAASSSHVWA